MNLKNLFAGLLVALVLAMSACAPEGTLKETPPAPEFSCKYEWVLELQHSALADLCPKAPLYTRLTLQKFERGFMILEPTNGFIYVFHDDGVLNTFADTYNGRDPLFSPYTSPPPGYYQPSGSLGLVWREEFSLRTKLGWATAPSATYRGWTQAYIDPNNYRFTMVRGIDGTIFRIRNHNGAWEVFSTP